jgi:hypothetical protein
MVLRFSPLLSPEGEEVEKQNSICAKGVSLESVTFEGGSRLEEIEIDFPRGEKKWNSRRICTPQQNRNQSLGNRQKYMK